MLNKFYYFPIGEPPPSVAANITIVHTFDAGLLAHLYGAGGNYPFCLVFRNAASAPLETLKDMLLLFFHPFYERSGYGKTLLVDVQPDCIEQLSARLQPLFGPQRLEIDLLPITTLKLLCPGPGEDAAGYYYRYCLKQYNPADSFLLQDSGEVTSDLIGELESSMADLRERHPQFYDLAMQHAGARRELDQLRHDQACLDEEKAILQQLLDLSTKHNEVNYILHFYKNEYEILPLWYQRFGHILKVLAGKRSFRSLYDKTAKKYKD